ncbi:WD40 repeat domain-containing protein [Mesorhizobium sp. M0768]|uniref:WD40 repeat domain-containing protein n=1 Tax=Mesorhizobium sp. M0768 TaxID=2956996 RepID=UPI00333D28FC
MSPTSEEPDAEGPEQSPRSAEQSRGQTKKRKGLDTRAEAIGLEATQAAVAGRADTATSSPPPSSVDPRETHPATGQPPLHETPPPAHPEQSEAPDGKPILKWSAAMRGLWQRLNAARLSALRLVQRIPATALVLLCALAVGFGIQWLVGDAETVLDGGIARPDVAREMVTSLAWLSNDRIVVGTASGTFYSHVISTNRTTSPTIIQQPVVGIVGVPGWLAGRDGGFWVTLSADLTRQFDPEAPPAALRHVVLHTGSELEADGGLFLEADGGLFATGRGTPVPVLAGSRPLTADLHLRQQQVGPQTGTTGLSRYDVGPDGGVEEVGLIDGLSNVSALAAAPDGAFAAAGTGDGEVVAIDLGPTGPTQVEDLAASRVGSLPGSIVAVAASGSRDNPVVAAAGANGRVAVFQAKAVREATLGLKTSDGADNFTFGQTEVGVPATNWKLFTNVGSSETYRVVGFSQDGRQIVIHLEKSGYFLQKIGDDGGIVESTKLDPPFDEGDGSPPLGVEEAVLLGGAIRGPALQAITTLSSALGQNKGWSMDVIVDRTRTRGAILVDDGRIFLFTAQDPNPVDLDVNGVNGAMAFSPQGDMLAVLMSEGPLRLYDTASRMLIAEGPKDISNKRGEGEISFSSDGKRIALTNDTGSITLFATTTLTPIAHYESHSGGLAHLAESGDFAIRRVDEQTFAIIELKTGKDILEAKLRNQTIRGLSISSDGRTVATAGNKNDLAVLVASSQVSKSGVDAIDFGQAAAPVGPPDRDGLTFSADGSRLMLRTRHGRLYVARMDGPESVAVSANRTETFFRFLEIPLDAPAVTADIAGDGSFLVAGDADNSLVLVDLTGATPQSFELPEHGAVVTQLAISPDRTKVAAASLDGRLRIVDLARERLVAGLPLARLASHADTPKMIVRRLDDAPGTFPDTAFLKQQTGARQNVSAAIVFGSHSSLAEAQAEVAALVRAHGTSLGMLVSVVDSGGVAEQVPAQIYLREGAYRTAVQVPFGQAAAFLKQVRKLAPATADAYARVLEPWCPNGTTRDGYTECGRPTPAPPPDDKKADIKGG